MLGLMIMRIICPVLVFFLMLDDSNKVLGGMRMVVQPFHDKKSFPSLNRLGVDFGEVFQRRGVDVSGMMVADISGIHVERETVRQHPGVMVPFIGSCYRAALGKGAKLAVVAPSKPFDMVVQGVMKKLSVPYADLGDYEIKLPEKTERKHVMVYSPQKELVQLQERVVQ